MSTSFWWKRTDCCKYLPVAPSVWLCPCQVCCIFFSLLCDKVLSLASLSDCALSSLLHLFLSPLWQSTVFGLSVWLCLFMSVASFSLLCDKVLSLASVWLRLFMSAASFSLFCDEVLRLLLLTDNFCMVLFCGVLLLYGAILWCTVFGPSDCTFSCLTASFLLCDKVLLLLITIDTFCIALFGVLSLAAFFHVCSTFYSLLCDSAKFGMFDHCELETSTFENGNTDCGLEWVGLKSFLLFTQLNLAETWMFAFSKNLRGQGPLSYSYMCPLIWSWSEVKVTGAQFHGELPCVHVEN